MSDKIPKSFAIIRNSILASLKKHDGDFVGMGDELNLSRSAVWMRIKSFNLVGELMKIRENQRDGTVYKKMLERKAKMRAEAVGSNWDWLE